MNHTLPRTNPSPAKGFVLLLSLVLLCLASLILAGLARHSLQLAVDARDESQLLQVRWGLTTLSRSFADRAPQISQARARSGNGAAAAPFPLRMDVPLGDLRFDAEIRLSPYPNSLTLPDKLTRPSHCFLTIDLSGV